MGNTIPRRARLDLNTPAELSITEAINEVEKVGAAPKLTMAIIKLLEAKDLLSDYVDENIKEIHAPTIGDWLRANGYYKKEDSWYSKLGVKKDYKSLIKIYEKNI